VNEFITALGLVFVIEGVISAAFPNVTKAAMLAAAEAPPSRLRMVGLAAAVLGVVLVWLTRT
jgi:uncharacterized protein YjeT (DUF2065 family)